MKQKRPRIIYFLISVAYLLNACNTSQKELVRLWTEEDRQELVDGLQQSQRDLFLAVSELNEVQWRYKVDEEQWSIAEIVEHLGLQQDMHYREVYVLSNVPPNVFQQSIPKENEKLIREYATPTKKEDASWNVEPLGRWCSKEDALNQFAFSRDKFIEFVTKTEADLRRHFTFRSLPDPEDYRNKRDLHQIILTTITHTQRHTLQIQTIKASQDFPG